MMHLIHNWFTSNYSLIILHIITIATFKRIIEMRTIYFQFTNQFTQSIKFTSQLNSFCTLTHFGLAVQFLGNKTFHFLFRHTMTVLHWACQKKRESHLQNRESLCTKSHYIKVLQIGVLSQIVMGVYQCYRVQMKSCNLLTLLRYFHR